MTRAPAGALAVSAAHVLARLGNTSLPQLVDSARSCARRQTYTARGCIVSAAAVPRVASEPPNPETDLKFTPRSLFGAIAVALLTPLVAHAAATPSGAASARVIVKFKADSALLRKSAASADQAQRDQALALGARVGLPMRAGFGIGERTQVVFVSGMSSEALAARLAAEKDIEYAVPDRRKTRAAVPNDPLYATGGTPDTSNLIGGPVVGQWYLKPPSSAARSAINAQSAWDMPAATSTPVVVAVLDTGIRADHPDLAGKLLPGYDFVGPDRYDDGTVIVPSSFLSSKDGNGWDANPSDEGDGITLAEANDPNGLFYQCTASDGAGGYVEEYSSWHGTQVSGIIGAATDNGRGMASVGRERVRVLPVRVLAKCGGWDSEIVAGMKWAAGIAVPGVPANPYPAQVLNMSLGGAGACTPLYADAVRQVNAVGAVVVASAGNGNGLAVSEPANCPGVIGVGGLRHEGDKVGYSDIGPELSLSAPAGNCVNINEGEPCLYPILTTANAGLFDPVTHAAGGSVYTDAFYATIGTSFSAPLVAGTAALMLSVNPNLSPLQVQQLLMNTSRVFPAYSDIPTCREPDGIPQEQCNCTTTTCGAGMLDAAAAVQAAAGGTGGGGSSGGGGGALGLGWLAALAAAVLGLRRGRRGAQTA